MNSASTKKFRRVWGMGLAMFALRLYQNTYDFEPTTGLHFLSVAGIALVVLIALSGVLAFVSTRNESRECPRFADHFPVPDRSTIVFVSASLLFAAGGAMLGVHSISTGAGFAPLVTAVFAFAAFFGFLLLTKQMRAGTAFSVGPALPVLFFSAFWVLTLYLPSANDPILARYYLPILAASMNAFAFAQLAGFLRGETRVRTFSFIAECAVMLSIAAIAEFNQHSLLFAACAVMLSAFLMLQETAPEPAEDASDTP